MSQETEEYVPNDWVQKKIDIIKASGGTVQTIPGTVTTTIIATYPDPPSTNVNIQVPSNK